MADDMTLEQVEVELAGIRERLAPLQRRHGLLVRRRRELRSKAFIAAYSLTRRDVEMSTGEGKPFFPHATYFAQWLRLHSSKRFCEWNGVIYHAADMMSGRREVDAPGLVEHLPE